MQVQQDAKKRIGTFLGLTVIFSAAIWAFVFAFAGGSLYTNQMYAFALMWSPGIAALLTTFIFQRNVRGLGWTLGSPRYLLLGILTPVLYVGAAYGIAWLTDISPFTQGKLPEGQSLVSFIALYSILGIVTGVIPALGEEIGWRGFLVPELANVTSFTKTAIISGVIWGIWHAPGVLFADYTSDAPAWYAYGGFFVMILGMSVVLAWLQLKSGSLWPAALMHGVHNLLTQAIFPMLTVETDAAVYLLGDFGVLTATAAVVAGFIFWRNWHTTPRQSKKTTTLQSARYLQP